MWMWHLDHELEDWFDALNPSRDGGGSDDPDDEDVPMMRNALVRR